MYVRTCVGARGLRIQTYLSVGVTSPPSAAPSGESKSRLFRCLSPPEVRARAPFSFFSMARVPSRYSAYIVTVRSASVVQLSALSRNDKFEFERV